MGLVWAWTHGGLWLGSRHLAFWSIRQTLICTSSNFSALKCKIGEKISGSQSHLLHTRAVWLLSCLGLNEARFCSELGTGMLALPGVGISLLHQMNISLCFVFPVWRVRKLFEHLKHHTSHIKHPVLIHAAVCLQRDSSQTIQLHLKF